MKRPNMIRPTMIRRSTKPIPKASPKKLAAWKSEGFTPRSTIVKRGKGVKKVNKKRRSSEFARAYGSKRRVEFVKSQPCVWCVLRGLIRIPRESDNAHTETGGMGYKAGYETIVPLCRRHHTDYDEYRAPFDKPSSRYAVAAFAARTEVAWQSLNQSE